MLPLWSWNPVGILLGLWSCSLQCGGYLRFSVHHSTLLSSGYSHAQFLVHFDLFNLVSPAKTEQSLALRKRTQQCWNVTSVPVASVAPASPHSPLLMRQSMWKLYCNRQLISMFGSSAGARSLAPHVLYQRTRAAMLGEVCVMKAELNWGEQSFQNKHEFPKLEIKINPYVGLSLLTGLWSPLSHSWSYPTLLHIAWHIAWHAGRPCTHLYPCLHLPSLLWVTMAQGFAGTTRLTRGTLLSFQWEPQSLLPWIPSNALPSTDFTKGWRWTLMWFSGTARSLTDMKYP